MELVHAFALPIPAAEAWKVLTDLERLAACMPGAALDDRGEDWATGRVKVKLGALTMEFRGKATFVDRDPAAGRFTVEAAGRDVSGQSSADARIAVTLTDAGAADAPGTDVEIITQLRTVGRVAQFGRTTLQDVSEKILRQFLAALESSLAAVDEDTIHGDRRTAGSAPTARAALNSQTAPAGDVLDLGSLTGSLLLSRGKLPLLVALAGLAGWLLRSLAGARRRQWRCCPSCGGAVPGR